jgi:hypothetical protein
MGELSRENEITTVAARARALMASLRIDSTDVVHLTEEARSVFAEVGDAARVRWLDHEISGYGTVSSVRPLHEVLALPPGDPLMTSVMAYRTQVGRRWPGSGEHDELVHFFVEPLVDLVSGRERLHSASPSAFVGLSFDAHPDAPQYPASAEFPADVFDRILAGFADTLQRELEGAAS